MQAQRIWSIGRARGKDSRQRASAIRAWMDLKYIALRPMQPGDHNYLIFRSEPFKCLAHQRVHFEPGVGRSFVALHGSFTAQLQTRTDHAYRTKLESSVAFGPCGSRRFGFVRGHSRSFLKVIQVLPAGAACPSPWTEGGIDQSQSVP